MSLGDCGTEMEVLGKTVLMSSTKIIIIHQFYQSVMQGSGGLFFKLRCIIELMKRR